jgi:signal transduction histidine kinase
VPEFERIARQTVFAAGVGVPGAVWASETPTWITDVVHDAMFVWAPAAARAGLHSVVAFPIQLGDQMLGVMVFLSRDIRQRDHDCLQMFAVIGGQIGQFIERKQTEEALRQSEARFRVLAQEREQQLIASDRLISFGELAASFAHEFNNPLGIVMGFAQDLLSEAQPTDRHYKRLRIIEAETRRCGQLMKDLLNLARPPQAYLIPTDLASVIRGTLELVAGRLRQGKVHPVLDLASDLPQIQADPQQLEQVLLNLFFNAIEAMPQGGTLTIRATRYREPLSAGPGTERTPHEEVLITITDTGIGIRVSHIRRGESWWLIFLRQQTSSKKNSRHFTGQRGVVVTGWNCKKQQSNCALLSIK